jgi:hypothetical protein
MRFVLSILAFLAVLLAPAGMLGSHAAMAMPQHVSASADPCSEKQQHGGQKSQKMIDCGIACSALASHQPTVADEPEPDAAAPDALPALALHGMRPEAATPPPRFP